MATEEDWFTPPPIPIGITTSRGGADRTENGLVSPERQVFQEVALATVDNVGPVDEPFDGDGNGPDDQVLANMSQVLQSVSDVSGPRQAPQGDGDEMQQAIDRLHLLTDEMSTLLERLEVSISGSAEQRANFVGGIESRLDNMLDLYKKKVDRTEYEIRSLENQTREIERYRDDLYGRIMTPLLLRVTDVAEKMSTTISFARANGEVSAVIDANDVETFVGMIEEVLQDNGVYSYTPIVGDKFDSSRFRVIGRVPTSDRSLHQRVAEVLGYGYELNGRPILLAAVKVYGYQAPEETV